jgi:hypothetical protein
VVQKARNLWVSTHGRQIGQFEDVGSPPNIPWDEEMEDETEREDMGRADRHTEQAELRISGNR